MYEMKKEASKTRCVRQKARREECMSRVATAEMMKRIRALHVMARSRVCVIERKRKEQAQGEAAE